MAAARCSSARWPIASAAPGPAAGSGRRAPGRRRAPSWRRGLAAARAGQRRGLGQRPRLAGSAGALAGTRPYGAGRAGDQAVAAAIWDLVWAGRLTNDTLAPLRTVLGARRQSPAGPVRAARAGAPPYGSLRAAEAPGRTALRRPGLGRPGLGRGAVSARGGPPTVSGRWSLLPPADADQTRRLHALAGTLLERHGIVIRGAAGGRAGPGRVRRALPGAPRDGGNRALPPRLLRRRPRCRPVRAARRRGPDARRWPDARPAESPQDSPGHDRAARMAGPAGRAGLDPGEPSLRPGGRCRLAAAVRTPRRARRRDHRAGTGRDARPARWSSWPRAARALRRARRQDPAVLDQRPARARAGRRRPGRRGPGRRPRPAHRGARRRPACTTRRSPRPSRRPDSGPPPEASACSASAVAGNVCPARRRGAEIGRPGD